MNGVAPLSKIRVQPLTCTIGAELFDVDLAEASRSDELFGEIRTLLLEHKVLFLRDQNITRGEHVALARRFGPLEDHPVAGSDPDHPGLVRIYKEIDSAPEHTRTPTTAMRPGGRARRWELCCAASKHRRWVETPSG